MRVQNETLIEWINKQTVFSNILVQYTVRFDYMNTRMVNFFIFLVDSFSVHYINLYRLVFTRKKRTQDKEMKFGRQVYVIERKRTM